MDDQLAEEFGECTKSGVGTCYGGIYGKHKKFTPDHDRQDWTVHIDEDNIQMYGLFSGFKGGSQVAQYAMNRSTYEIFSKSNDNETQPISRKMNHDEVIEALRHKFNTVDRRYNDHMDDMLCERFVLKEEDKMDNSARVSEIEERIRGGSSALIVLRIDSKLYILNCGSSRAMVLTDESSSYVALNCVHDSENEMEVERLLGLGIDPEVVSPPTRALGDFFRRALYDEDEKLKVATSQPVIADPDVICVEIEPSWKYLVLISAGVVQNLMDSEVEDIYMEIYDKLREQHTPTSTAQSMVDGFARKHLEAYSKHLQEVAESSASSRREEMTLIYVKLRVDEYGTSTFDSSLNSTCETTVDIGPYAPYIDITEEHAQMLSEQLEHLLLPLEETSHQERL